MEVDKFRMIHQDIVAKIKAGKYKPGMYLPSDTKLVEQYQASRETIRKAMMMLVDEGYAQRFQGKGTLVLNYKHFAFPISTLESYRELVAEINLESSNDVLKIKSDVPVPHALLFENDPLDESILVLRRRNVEGKPMVLDYDYINPAVVDSIPKCAAQDSLFNYFENDLGLKIDYAIKHMTVEKATADDQKLLMISGNTPIVVVRSETHLANNAVLSFTESRHRADRFTSVEFSRRRK